MRGNVKNARKTKGIIQSKHPSRISGEGACRISGEGGRRKISNNTLFNINRIECIPPLTRGRIRARARMFFRECLFVLCVRKQSEMLSARRVGTPKMYHVIPRQETAPRQQFPDAPELVKYSVVPRTPPNRGRTTPQGARKGFGATETPPTRRTRQEPSYARVAKGCLSPFLYGCADNRAIPAFSGA